MNVLVWFGVWSKNWYIINLLWPWYIGRTIHYCELISIYYRPGRVAQSVTCLATDACQTADQGVASSIPVRYHTFVEIVREIISMVLLLRWFIQEEFLSVTSESADSVKKSCCQLQAKVLIHSRRVVVSYKRKCWFIQEDLLSVTSESADSFKKSCWQLQAKVCAQITG